MSFQQIRNTGFEIFIYTLGVLCGSANLFLYCFFGKLASDSFAKMADCLYEYNWYELPFDLEKYFIIMIANAQKPLFYDGFGVLVLNLQTFTNVS